MRAVVFDLDDTLIVEQEHAMASLREALSVFPGSDPISMEATALASIRRVWRRGDDYARCHSLGIASWEGLWATFEGNHPSLDGLLRWGPTFRIEAWNAVAAAFDHTQDGLSRAASERFQQAQHRGHPLIEGAVATLEQLARHHRIGLLTNGPSDLQRLKLDQAGITSLFDAVVISGEVGVGKPDGAVFAEVLGRLDTRPEDSIMVGDNWERDVVGATGAGMKACWIASGRPMPVADDRVTAIDDLGDLSQLVS